MAIMEGVPMANGDEEYLKVSEVASRLRVSRFTVYKWIREGKLEGSNFGGVVRISRASFDAFKEQSRIKTSQGNQTPTSVVA
jgi:excisionase family DNA binding protein